MKLKHYCLVAAAATLPIANVWACSYREAPNVARMPTVDSTDFYLFSKCEAGGDGAAALQSARRNFGLQREVTDVRGFAAAGVMANDSLAMRELRAWLSETRFADAVTEGILGRHSRG